MSDWLSVLTLPIATAAHANCIERHILAMVGLGVATCDDVLSHQRLQTPQIAVTNPLGLKVNDSVMQIFGARPTLATSLCDERRCFLDRQGLCQPVTFCACPECQGLAHAFFGSHGKPADHVHHLPIPDLARHKSAKILVSALRR